MDNTSLLDIYNHISIQQYKTDMGFKSLVEGVHENLFVIPEYQRKYRWSKEQVEELAASLIRDLPIPPIYTFRNEKGQLEILDGQQRVMSLYFYFIGKFFKSSKESGFDYRELALDNVKNFEEALESQYDIEPTHFYMNIGNERCDISYQELPVEIRRKVDYITIPVVEIKIANQELKDVTLHKIFTNLNNGGVQLSDQELRNGIFPCEFSRMIDLLNRNHLKWRNLYGPIEDTCKDMELLYRFCALKKYVELCNDEFIIKNYQYSIKKLIDQFAEDAFFLKANDIACYKESLENFIDSLEISKTTFRNNVLLMEGLYVIQETRNIRHIITEDICKRILDNLDYKNTTSGGTISLKNMNKRWRIIYEMLSNDG